MSNVQILFCILAAIGWYHLSKNMGPDLERGFFVESSAIEAAEYYSKNYIGDILLLEDQEPVDAVYEFVAQFGTHGEKHLNPLILRSPRQQYLLEQLCEDSAVKALCGKRSYAREQMLENFAINQWGLPFKMRYLRPENESACLPRTDIGEDVTSCHVAESKKFCARLAPEPPNCVAMIAQNLVTAIDAYEAKRFDGKDLYRAVGVLKDASNETIYKKIQAMKLEWAMPCFKGPTRFLMPEVDQIMHVLGKAWETFKDPDEREFYDQPCRIVFG